MLIQRCARPFVVTIFRVCTLTTEKQPRSFEELHDSDKYPFSPRIRTLRGIFTKLRPEPVREPLPPRKVYASPRAKIRTIR
jgi:hypothetical protein